MMVSLFVSRAVLSVSMIAFVVISFSPLNFKKQLENFFASPLLWGISLLFLIPLVSGLWSENFNDWSDSIRIKLPLLFMPLAFAGTFYFSKKQWEWLGYIFIFLITSGTCWSMFHYLSNATEVNQSYLRAKSIITPLENDHVRFSWLVSVCILLAGWFCVTKRKEEKTISNFFAIIALWLIIFLHFLAARTGLFSFYLMALIISVWLIFKKTKRLFGFVIPALLILFPLIAYKTIPTFHNRIHYFLYDREYFKKANYLPGTTDAVRVISLKAGWSVMNEHQVTGVGFGDILKKTKDWYDVYYPQMIETDKIYPGSEWLMYGSGCGWPGFLFFSLIMLIPFFIETNNKLLWILLNINAAFSFLFDIGLEVQFGVFIYSFIILWWHKWLNEEMNHKKM